MESLRKYIDQLGVSQSDFASKVGVSKGYMSQILSGARLPSRGMIEKINIATDGDVPPHVWFKTSEGAA